MGRGWIAIVVVGALGAGGIATATSAQPSVREALGKSMAEKPGEPMPANRSDLDGWLKAKAYTSITKSLQGARTADDVLRDLNWEQVQIYNGATILISFAYMHDLWRLGSALPAAQGDQMKQSAVAFGLYAVELISLDGPSCADPSAPAHRRDQLFFQNKPLWTYAIGLPDADKAMIVKVALAVERGTAPVRAQDEVLCSGGMTEISQGLTAQGDKPLPQVPNQPGTFGKSYAVPDAPGYHPAFKPEAAWRPQQADSRAKMPALLNQLLKVDAPKATPPSPPN